MLGLPCTLPGLPGTLPGLPGTVPGLPGTLPGLPGPYLAEEDCILPGLTGPPSVRKLNSFPYIVNNQEHH